MEGVGLLLLVWFGEIFGDDSFSLGSKPDGGDYRRGYAVCEVRWGCRGWFLSFFFLEEDLRGRWGKKKFDPFHSGSSSMAIFLFSYLLLFCFICCWVPNLNLLIGSRHRGLHVVRCLDGVLNVLIWLCSFSILAAMISIYVWNISCLSFVVICVLVLFLFPPFYFPLFSGLQWEMYILFLERIS